ncbi:alanine racemase [Glycomyces sp. NPDC046736]|uniref:alanine racemase n=1 Tax=Glycomyces sp. NPDC046736 TaxID=3155615 RepID=UPI0033CF70F5
MNAGRRDTPVVRISQPRLDTNVRHIQHEATLRGVALRVHTKGHRTIPIAKLQAQAGAVGIITQTTTESAAYLDAGIRDIVIARPRLDQWRLPVFARFAAESAAREPESQITVQVSNEDDVTGLSAEATAAGAELDLRIDVSFGPDRGINPASVRALAERIADAKAVRLDGITGYTSLHSPDDLKHREPRVREIASELVGLAQMIRDDGIACPTVAVNGTPGILAAAETPGVTEICTGATALYDAGFASAGVCDFGDVAISVRATVVRAHGGRVETDADELLTGASHEWAPDLVATMADGRALDSADVREGDIVELIPAHICPFILNGPEFHVIDADGDTVAHWAPALLPEARH